MQAPMVETVLGPVAAGELGIVLPHEHLCASRGLNEALEPPDGYRQRVETWERSVIREAQACGVRTFVDVTPIGLGRFLPLYQRLSRDTGLHVVASTGFYVGDQRPAWVKDKSVEDLADLFIGEICDGIGPTGIKAGMIKVGANGDPRTNPEDLKVFRAAALAQRTTGVAITTHSCHQVRCHFDCLVEAGAAPSRVYIGHADFGADNSEQEYVARAGGHLIFTCWGIEHFVPQEQLAHRVVDLVAKGLGAAVLMSIDYALLIGGNRMDLVSMEYECPTRTPAFLFRYALPRLRERGITEDHICQFLIQNPRRMLVAPSSMITNTAARKKTTVILTWRPRQGLAREPLTRENQGAALGVINEYLAGWPYTRPADDALVQHWKAQGPRYQPEHLLLATRDGQVRAFAHGQRDGTTHFMHLLAVAPGAVDEAAWLLAQIEADARKDGVTRLCGPHYRSAQFYAGYVLGREPYHPHWAAEGTAAYVRAGFRPTHQGVLLVYEMRQQPLVEPVPAGYELRGPEPVEEFGARACRYAMHCGGQEVAFCGARLYPELAGPGGGPVGQLGHVATVEAHRNKGLARVLCEAAVSGLRQMGAGEVLVGTGLEFYPALRVYERIGFQRRCALTEWSKDLK